MEEKILLATSFLTLAGIMYSIVRGFLVPNFKQDQDILEMQTACKYKHKKIDDDVSSINKSLILIKDNELKHIEERINGIENNQTKIFTILEERLPKK